MRKSIKAAKIENGGVFMPYLVYRFDSKKFQKNKIKIKNKNEKRKEEIKKEIENALESMFRQIEQKYFDEFRKIAKLEEEIKRLKVEMLKALNELSAYEILPGACKCTRQKLLFFVFKN
ncbi:MAG: hypothetical protein H0Z28_09835 [Archaeoglobus sp.]|nr:hypothetical protein [Archaeoglobus sp.]